jgi:hypothetical protein
MENSIVTKNNRAPHAASVGGPKPNKINNPKYSLIERRRKDPPLYRQLDALLSENAAAAVLPLGQRGCSFDDLIVVLRGTQIPDDFFDTRDCKPRLEVLP